MRIPSATTSASQSAMLRRKRGGIRLQKAALDDFIRSLPKGYDTPVGELGGTLSGGERQRIGVARAFLHDAPFLLLDEPTSNLDSLNEGIILRAVRAECKDRTVLLVSHRKVHYGCGGCELLGRERKSKLNNAKTGQPAGCPVLFCQFVPLPASHCAASASLHSTQCCGRSWRHAGGAAV